MSKNLPELNILWLWPDILNLHGDRANVMALSRVSRLYDIEAKISRVSRLTDDFDPACADIILLGSGELAVMPEITGVLSKKYPELKTYAESGGTLFATGTTGAALGVHTLRLDGSHLYGIGLLDMECKERKAVLGDDVIFRPEAIDIDIDKGISTPDIPLPNMSVYGIQIQMTDIHLAAGQAPLGRIVYGYGNNGGGGEGAAKDGVIFTNASGPVLVKNPWLTLALIKKALFRKAPGLDPDILSFDPAKFETELASAKAIQVFNDKKEKPR